MGYVGVFVLLYSALMTGIYMLSLNVRGWFSGGAAAREANAQFHDPSWLMLLPLAIFSVVTVALGLNAQPLMAFVQSIATGTF